MIQMINGTPTLADVKAWLGLEDADEYDDVVLQESLDAALVAQGRVVCYPCDEFGDRIFSEDLRNAVFLRTQRYASRRNSPEGVLSFNGGDAGFTTARVASFDTDVAHLEGPYLKIPVA